MIGQLGYKLKHTGQATYPSFNKLKQRIRKFSRAEATFQPLKLGQVAF